MEMEAERLGHLGRVWLGGPGILQGHPAPSHPWDGACSLRGPAAPQPEQSHGPPSLISGGGPLRSLPVLRCSPSLGHPWSPASTPVRPDDINNETINSVLHTQEAT